MPKVTAELSDEPLFTDDDPLELEIPGVGSWRLSNFDVTPPNEDDINPETQPVKYLVALISGQAWETEEDNEQGLTPNAEAMAEAIVDALDARRITITELSNAISGVSALQRKAAKARTARLSGRPTRGRRR